MGWVSLNTGDQVVYYGVDAGLGERIEICDSCNEPKPVSSGSGQNDLCWICFRCQTVNQREYK